MPQPAILKDDPQSWPFVKFFLTDLCTKTVVAEVEFQQQDWKDMWCSTVSKNRLKHLSQYSTLEIEAAFGVIKLVENGTNTFIIPTYLSPNELIFEKLSQVVLKHKFFLGELLTLETTMSSRIFSGLVDNLQGVAKSF